ncbi:MAG: selenocysteine protein [DPANN group archaeon]|nr:selenocysteine protein [DPANN group archaeon]
MLAEIFLASLKESLVIITLIFVMMVIVEFLVLRYRRKITSAIGKGRFFSYILSSSFGIIPGCVGTFTMDTLYMGGLLSFGGIVAVMVATSGDEAFLMLSLAASGKLSWALILVLMLTLFLFGILAGWLGDVFVKKTRMTFCKHCSIVDHRVDEFNIRHFMKKHIVEHILRRHLWKIFLWVFAALFVIGLSEGFINADHLFAGQTMIFVLVIAALIGLLPISGPNVFLVMLFSQGLIPFSILLANSIVQDGHGLLPIMGFSMDDAVKIKAFNFVFGLVVGGVFLALGF